MKFKLTPMFTQADIQKEVATFLERVHKVTRNELIQIGLEFVTEARQKTKGQGGFDDQTGNLRSSIGFVLTYDGAIVHEDFSPADKGTDKTTGLGLGRSMAADLVESQGWGIITVAGMEYASWVEAKGYDVITGSTLGAQGKLEKAFKRVEAAFK